MALSVVNTYRCFCLFAQKHENDTQKDFQLGQTKAPASNKAQNDLYIRHSL